MSYGSCGPSAWFSQRDADVCIDGNGTEVDSTYDAMGNIMVHCAQAMDKNGKPMFVDGISVELNLTTGPIHAIKPPM